jgi:hypothetical protein
MQQFQIECHIYTTNVVNKAKLKDLIEKKITKIYPGFWANIKNQEHNFVKLKLNNL